ncbi:MAG: alpha/beta hydrolase [Gammaproteobacteria bacterium]|nr:MAG: alpha/beta hydrolase [Gammaproteobacteria bacterium]
MLQTIIRPLKLTASLTFAFLFSAHCFAFPIAHGNEYKLWPATPPGTDAINLTEKSKDSSKDANDPQRTLEAIASPTIRAFIPAHPNGTAAVITVGGGYTSLVIDKEGTDIAKWLNTLGVTAFVIKNRLPGEGHADGKNVPLQDAQRALRLVRANAAEWKLDANKIGIVGLSSGGHLASTLGTNYNKKVYEPIDASDKVSARPSFLVLAYGPHSGNARKYLINPTQKPLEPAQKQALYDEYPTDQQVTSDTPPTFLVTADNDDKVDSRNSTRFYDALKAAGVPAELHIFQDGKHGFAIRNAAGYPVAIWPQLCESWFKANHIIP